MNRPTDLTPTQYAALLFVINPSNWENDIYGQQRIHGTSLANHLGYRSNTYAYALIRNLMKKGYLDARFKPTPKCDGMSKSLTMKGAA